MYIGILTSVAREEHLIPQLEYHLIFGKLLRLEVIACYGGNHLGVYS
jgi:hypothetical protein